MTDHSVLPRVTEITVDGAATDSVALTYEARFVRRKRLVSDSGLAFLVDFPKATNLGDGAVLVLNNGHRIVVRAAPEALIEVRGPLPRLAWHIGNRHTPCQIGTDHLRILHDHVLADMLAGLGADLGHITAPFTPEGGAYGLGRTFSHSHDPHSHDD